LLTTELAIVKGKVIIPFTNSNKTLKVKPSTLKGNRISHSTANRNIPTIAKGQHSAKRINQSKRAIKNLMLLEFSLTNSFYVTLIIWIHISGKNCTISKYSMVNPANVHGRPSN